ncbi:MAG: Fic family protein [Phycisphaeraceae bacterium]|nr:Fic family protein [Phycisphaeraceae bacterium]
MRYHTDRFPPRAIDYQRLVRLIGPANAAVARFEGLLHAVPNAQVLLTPLSTQEAVLSSKIEGTQATFGEVLEFEASAEAASEEKLGDIREVLQYRAALRESVTNLGTMPLSQRLIRQAHGVLMQGVRGQNKTPGEYRRIPNWIGPKGCDLDGARFVPPPANEILERMSMWERYLHGEEPDLLVQLAVLHVEFEAIHPFLDGNGRLGRLLVPLFMVDKGLLSAPQFYISAYFEKDPGRYYDRLLAVSRDDDWTGWCEYFLGAIIAQAKDNESKARAILDLYRAKKDWITDLTRSQFAVRALDWFFEKPVFRASDLAKSSKIPTPTAKRIIREVRDAGMLVELRAASGRRPAILAFPELLNIAEGRSVF